MINKTLSGPATEARVQVFRVAGREVLCKLEGWNASGSHKDRPARALIESLQASGRLSQDTDLRLVVSSSGNFARAIAHHTAGVARVQVTVVTDALSPTALIDGLRAYPHVRVIVVNEPDATGSHLHARKRVIRELLTHNPGSLYFDQYDNPQIPQAYERSLAPEIERQASRPFTSVFVPVGTGATLNGLLRYRRQKGATWRAFAVDADGSGLFRRPCGLRRALSGYGNGHATGLIRGVLEDIDHVVYIADQEALAMCRQLVRCHGLLLGPSSGATLAAIAKVAKRRPDLLPAGDLSVAILPDRGDSYPEILNEPPIVRPTITANLEEHHVVSTPVAV